MKIPVAKPWLTEEEAKAVYDTVLSNWVTQGPKVEEFEKAFANYVGSQYAIAVSSCTAALHLSLIVAGIKAGDEVICPSLSFIATANSIVMTGAKPIFGEIEPHTLNLDPHKVESLITPKTKAILLVHQIGLPANIDAFKEICMKHNLRLIEDAACAIGSEYKGQKIGSHSDLVCFSLHPRKIITTGDGGIICTSNPAYYERLKLLRQHGMSVNDRERHLSDKIITESYIETGFNYRLTDIQAAIGLTQLKKLDWLIEKRRSIANQYMNELKGISCIQLPKESEEIKTNFQSFQIYLKESCSISRDDLMQKLLDEGISTRRGIMTAHREPAYSKYHLNQNLSISENVSDRSIILPLYATMTTEEIEYVCSHLKKLIDY